MEGIPKRWRLDRREAVAFALAEDSPAALRRLHGELTWYHESALRKKRAYRAVKSIEITLAAMVPLAASLGWGVTTIGIFGVVIVICQGIQQLFQLQPQWLAHRAIYENLKREESLYLARAGPYKGSDEPEVLLAERIEDLREIETAQWMDLEKTTAAKADQEQQARADART